MKTPINGARLSSSYGMRKHPILGYNKMQRNRFCRTYWNSNYGLRVKLRERDGVVAVETVLKLNTTLLMKLSTLI